MNDFAPLVGLFAGLSAAGHCVGMCGGLVAASAHSLHGVWAYQVGRLFGYLGLTLVGILLGRIIRFGVITPVLSEAAMALVALGFIYAGLMRWRGQSLELPLPRRMGQLYQRLYGLLTQAQEPVLRSLSLGLISVLLPCGVLYAAIAAALALANPLAAILGVLAFWLGTLPAMVMAPALLKRILRPLGSRWPRATGLALILLGLLTLGQRWQRLQSTPAAQAQEAKSCH